MIDYIQNGTIVESFSRYPESYTIGGVQYRIRDLVKAGHDVEALGFFERDRDSVTLASNEYVSGYDLQVIEGRPVEVPLVSPKTQAMLDADRERKSVGIVRERQRRLAVGFDYDFGDSRGVHRIGTTEQDHRGWEDVTKLSTAAILGGAPNTTINIMTDTGPVQVTAAEWQQIIVAAGLFGQPIWAASFALQAMDPIPENFTDGQWWP